MTSHVRRVGIITSGGDSPGFNPFVRAVVRMAAHYGWEVLGIQRGYAGLISGDMVPLDSRSVSGVIGMGGTFLGSSRSDAFATPRGLREALRNLNEVGIDALAIIGGDGTMRGALALQEAGMPVIGAPGTIENDVCGTDVSIGVDTALNTALDAMDRIRDTASSHQQVFIVEMMGEKSGYLALMAGIAGGAEMVCIPEEPFGLDDVTREVGDAYIRGKKHCIITTAEGARPHAREIADHLRAHEGETGFGARLSILGHIQRGGSPSAYDRFLGTRLGAAAVERLSAGESGLMVGILDNAIIATPLSEVAECTRHIDESYLNLAKVLAR
jgi:6-phosphofructokinase 1